MCSTESLPEVVEFKDCQELEGVNFEKLAGCAFRVETEACDGQTISVGHGNRTVQVRVKPGLNYVNLGGGPQCVDFLVRQVLTKEHNLSMETLAVWHAAMVDESREQAEKSVRSSRNQSAKTVNNEFYKSLVENVRDGVELGSLEAVVLVSMVGKTGFDVQREGSARNFGEFGDLGGFGFDPRRMRPEVLPMRTWARKLVQSIDNSAMTSECIKAQPSFHGGLKIVVDVVRSDTPEAKYDFLLLGQVTQLQVGCLFGQAHEADFKLFVSKVMKSLALLNNLGIHQALLMHSPTLNSFDEVWELANQERGQRCWLDLLRQAATRWAVQFTWRQHVGALVKRLGRFTWKVCEVVDLARADLKAAVAVFKYCVNDPELELVKGEVGASYQARHERNAKFASCIVKWFGSLYNSATLSRGVDAANLVGNIHPNVGHQELLYTVNKYVHATMHDLCSEVARLGDDLIYQPRGLQHLFVSKATNQVQVDTMIDSVRTITSLLGRTSMPNGFSVKTMCFILEKAAPTKVASLTKVHNLMERADVLCEVATWVFTYPALKKTEIVGELALRASHAELVANLVVTNQIILKELRAVLAHKEASRKINQTFGLPNTDLDAVQEQVTNFDEHMNLLFEFRSYFSNFVDAHLASLVAKDREAFKFEQVVEQLGVLIATKTNYHFLRVLALKKSPGFLDMMNKQAELSSDLVEFVIPKALAAWDSFCAGVCNRSVSVTDLELYKLHTWDDVEEVSPRDDALKHYLTRRTMRDSLPGVASLLAALKVDPSCVVELHQDILAGSTCAAPLVYEFKESSLFDEFVTKPSSTVELMGTLGKAAKVVVWLGDYPEQTLFDSKLIIARSTGAIDAFVEATEALRRIRTELANLWYGGFSDAVSLFRSMPNDSSVLLGDARVLATQGAMLIDALDSQDSLAGKTKELASLTEFVVQVVGVNIDGKEVDTKKATKNDNTKVVDYKVQLFARKSGKEGVERSESYLEDLIASFQVTHVACQDVDVASFSNKLKQAREYRDLVAALVVEGYPHVCNLCSVNNFCTLDLTSKLCAWQNLVESMRRKYYFLNFYTIKEIWRIYSLIDATRTPSSTSTSSSSNQELVELRHLLSVAARHEESMVDALLDDTQGVQPDLESIGAWLQRHIKSLGVADAGMSKFMLMGNSSDSIWLCVTSANKVFETTLSVFVHNNRLPFPCEVVFCRPDTTRETLGLALTRFARARANDMGGLVTCLVEPDKLSFDTQTWLAGQVEQSLSASPGTLVLVTTDKTSYIATALSSHLVPQLLASNAQDVTSDLKHVIAGLTQNRALCVVSEHEGAGKTLRARKLSINTRFVAVSTIENTKTCFSRRNVTV